MDGVLEGCDRPVTTIEGETIEVELMGNDEYLPLYISETVAAGSCRTAAATSAWWWWYEPPI
jgi:hypothetical protein